VKAGGRRFEVAYVPGHAKHHVAYYEADSGTLWAGDTAGVRIGDGPPVPVTPPPDIDVEAWNASMDRMLAWNPSKLVTAHFGAHEDPVAHFRDLRASLHEWAARVRASLTGHGADASDSEMARAFADRARAELGARVSRDVLDAYVIALSFSDSWRGLARYWRKRGFGETGGRKSVRRCQDAP